MKALWVPFCCLFLTVGMASAQNRSVADLQQLFEDRATKVAGERDAKVAGLSKSYSAKLERLLRTYTSSGRLDEALLVKAELDDIQQGKLTEPDRDISAAADLQDARKLFSDALQKIEREADDQLLDSGTKFQKLLERRMKKLTRAGKLAEAEKARDLAEKTESEIVAPIQRKRAVNKEAILTQALEETSWSYFDEYVHRTDPAQLDLEPASKALFKGRTGIWKVTDSVNRRVSLLMPEWTKPIILTFNPALTRYKGVDQKDESKREGKRLKR